MTKDNFSIIIPVYNAEDTITECLKRVLASKGRGDEIIISDNNSTDKTREIVKKYPIKYVICKKKGAGANRNYGVRFAKHDTFVFLDSDVMIKKDSIEKMRQLLRNKKISAASGMYTATAGYSGWLSKFQNLYTYATFAFIGGKKKRISCEYLWTAFCAIRRKAFDEVNGFDESLSRLEDTDLGIRLAKKGHIIVLDKTIQNTHKHKFDFKIFFNNNYTKTKVWVKTSFLKGIMNHECYYNMKSKLLLLSANMFIFTLFFMLIRGIFISGLFMIIPFLFLAFFCILNYKLYLVARKTYGNGFMLVTIPLSVLLYFFIALGILGGLVAAINNSRSERKSIKLGYKELFRLGFRVLCKKNSMPEVLIFFVTSKCNARCGHCFFWKNINKEKNELTLEEIKKIAYNLPHFSHLFITGGEPFLRKDLPEIVETFYRNNKLKSISIPTNGLLTKKIAEDVNKICQRNPKLRLMIQLSIDNIYEKHDKNRGVEKLFKNLVESAREIRKLKKRFKNLSMGTSCVFTKNNQNEIYDIYKFIKNDIKVDSASFPLVRGDVKDKDNKIVDIEKYKKFLDFLDQEYSKKMFVGYNNFFLPGFSNVVNMEAMKKVYETAKLNKHMHPCYACQLIGTVYSNGDVHCCEILPKKIGNLRKTQYKFEKIWNSKKAGNIRKWIKDSKCFCTHECFIYVNLLFNPLRLKKLLLKYLKYKIRK